MNNISRVVLISLTLALSVVAALCIGEFYAATRFESQYVSAKEYPIRPHWLLTGKRERGTLVRFDSHGYHAVSPEFTRDEVSQKLKERYPNEFDPKKVTWVLTDEEGAFFFRLVPNWLAVAVAFAMVFVAGIFPARLVACRQPSPFLLKGRLADVLALIQVLALDKSAHRSESGLFGELQGNPTSSPSWTEIAKAHPEFFRVKSSGENIISLVARHVVEPQGQSRAPLSTEYVASLLKLAVEVHDRELQRTRGWQVWLPLVIAVIAGIFTVVGATVR